MATLTGNLRKNGKAAANLSVLIFEEIPNVIDYDDGISWITHPSIRQLASLRTDAEGRFNHSYQALTAPESGNTNRAIFICVYEGKNLLWQSPKKILAEGEQQAVEFNSDLRLLDELDLPATIHGTLTVAGFPATGYRVVAYEKTIVGFPSPFEPCEIGPLRRKLIGDGYTDNDGRYSYRYAQSAEPPQACFFFAKVYIEVYDGLSLLWKSSEFVRDRINIIDAELFPECPAGSTVVRVIIDNDDPAPGAQVYLNGNKAGVTNDLGVIYLPNLQLGDQLVARLRLSQHSTPRQNHNADSTSNWNYRVYVTSMRLSHDGSGNNPEWRNFIISNPHSLQRLRLRRNNVIVGFNLRISVEWEATTSELHYLRDRVAEFSELLFNSTDGQFLVERLEMSDKGNAWNSADVRVFATINLADHASYAGAIADATGYIFLNRYGALFPGTMLHEFGHYGFYVMDEYEPGNIDCPGDFVPCTPKASIPGTPYSSDTGTKDSCFMRGSQYGARKKLCSSHPSNPHTVCTEQGLRDCWSVVAEKYDGGVSWTIKTPVTRGVIVDRLRDSGVPMDVTTEGPSGAQSPDSYIPMADWKLKWHVSRHPRTGECPNKMVRVVTRFGPTDTPVNVATVTLVTTQGLSLIQGRTNPRHYADGTVTGNGEIPLRGAHLGDRVNAVFFNGLSTLIGSAVIDSAEGTLVVVLRFSFGLPALRISMRAQTGIEINYQLENEEQHVAPLFSVQSDGRDEVSLLNAKINDRNSVSLFLPTGVSEESHTIQSTVFDKDGNAAVIQTRISSRKIAVDDEGHIVSVSGEVELKLPAGAFPDSVQVLIEELHDFALPALEKDEIYLVPPHRIICSGTDKLLKPALVYLNVANAIQGGHKNMKVKKWNEKKGKWETIKHERIETPLVAIVTVTSLGVFALTERG